MLMALRRLMNGTRALATYTLFEKIGATRADAPQSIKESISIETIASDSTMTMKDLQVMSACKTIGDPARFQSQKLGL